MNNLKKHVQKILSGFLALTVLCCSIGVTAYSAGTESVNPSAAAAKSAAKKEDSPSDSVSNTISKDETVYVIADADGSAKKVIVSDWIKNTAQNSTIHDFTTLSDIENVKGDETYTMDKDNMCIWDANGNDIYYQGTGTKALPVELSVQYQLDGTPVSAEELAGKSGKVTMHFSYKNNQYEIVNVNGKDEKIYVPFVMLTGMILDNEHFKNVEISNGKIINDGDKTIVAGFALPGMSDNLNIDKDKLNIPDFVEITADTTEFELSTTMTLASNNVLNDVDLSKASDSVDDLSASLKEMSEATDKLIDGSSELYNGISTLLDKSAELISGVKELADGAKQVSGGASALNSGAQDLNNGAKDLNGGAKDLNSGAASLQNGASALNSGAAQLQSGITSLASGLGTLSSNSSSLVCGAKQVFDTLLSAADTQISAAGLKADKLTIENYNTVLKGICNSLDEDTIYNIAYQQALKIVTDSVNQQKLYIHSQVESTVRTNVLESVLSAAGIPMTAEEYTAAVSAGTISAEMQQQISAAVENQMSGDAVQSQISSAVQSKIQELIDQNMNSEEVKTQIQNAVDQAKSGLQSITKLIAQLDSYKQFYEGLVSYTSGVDTANAGAAQLVSGSKSLKDGTAELADGTGTLKNGTDTLLNGTDSLLGGTGSLLGGTGSLLSGTKALNDGMQTLQNGSDALVIGVQQLKDGSMQLSDGLKEFKKEGVQKLVDAVDGDIKGLVSRLQASQDVSKNYKSYGGIGKDMDGKVDFLFKTDAIEPITANNEK